MKIRSMTTLMLVLTLAACSGCAKKADPNKPVDQIKKDVETMSVAELQSTAAAYAKEIKVQKTELSKIAEELKGVPVKDVFSDKAKSIKNRLGEVQTKASALMERYQLYFNKLQEKGADISKVRLD
ncbi:MAG: hypothetical protein PHS88_06725 [Candidatus Omnitrophica bacterium]|nr:hypothetical protein [Candidatus Omnitrophota bacterium]